MKPTDRMLIFSDLHLRPETEDVCFKVLDDVLATAKTLDGCKTIAFLGDWWHLRYAVPVHLLNRVAKWVSKVLTADLELILLPGNHDQIDELGQHALEVFSEFGARVYSEPFWDAWGAWMPYRKDRELVKAVMAQWLQNPAPPKTLFAHLPVCGAMMNNLMADKDGIPAEAFNGFQKIILGHYHKRQDFLDGRVTYVGSPWQTRADEYGQKKGFAVWDGAQLSFIDRKHGRCYHRFEAPNAMSLKQQVLEAQPDPDDIISIVVPTKSDLDATLKLLHKGGFQHVVGNAKDLAIPQPRYGFQKSTMMTEYAAFWAKEKGKEIASYDDLMAVWAEICG